MPAAAVIPAPMVYINIAAVKAFVVDFHLRKFRLGYSRVTDFQSVLLFNRGAQNRFSLHDFALYTPFTVRFCRIER